MSNLRSSKWPGAFQISISRSNKSTLVAKFWNLRKGIWMNTQSWDKMQGYAFPCIDLQINTSLQGLIA